MMKIRILSLRLLLWSYYCYLYLYHLDLSWKTRESFGEDIVDTDVEKGSSDDYDYSDSFINDDDDDGQSARASDDDECMFFTKLELLAVIIRVTTCTLEITYCA